MAELTQAYLKQILNYDPETGIFTWLVSRGTAKIGSIAGSPTSNGYTRIMIDGKDYLTHRLAWLYMTGEWPVELVDHKDLRKSNDVWENLREATRGQNRTNSRKNKNNSSGFRGVYLHQRMKKWCAKINVNNRRIHLGCFDDPKEAHNAYCKEALKVHGNFARFN